MSNKMIFRNGEEHKAMKVGYGAKFRIGDSKFILSAVSVDHVQLIDMERGSRMREPIKVKDITHLTRNEFERCFLYSSCEIDNNVEIIEGAWQS